jgi:uncharacterized protein
MKYIIITCGLLLATLITGAQRTSTFPSPTGFVNDYENDFTPDQLKSLNYAVKELLIKTMTNDSLKDMEIAVVTVTDAMYGDEKEMSGYLTRLGDKWNIGSKSGNKGIIIGYGKKIRKVAIVTGAGLDNVLTPVQCRTIIDEKMTPQFKKGDYYNAILTAIKSITDYLALK